MLGKIAKINSTKTTATQPSQDIIEYSWTKYFYDSPDSYTCTHRTAKVVLYTTMIFTANKTIFKTFRSLTLTSEMIFTADKTIFKTFRS